MKRICNERPDSDGDEFFALDVPARESGKRVTFSRARRCNGGLVCGWQKPKLSESHHGIYLYARPTSDNIFWNTGVPRRQCTHTPHPPLTHTRLISLGESFRIVEMTIFFSQHNLEACDRVEVVLRYIMHTASTADSKVKKARRGKKKENGGDMYRRSEVYVELPRQVLSHLQLREGKRSSKGATVPRYGNRPRSSINAASCELAILKAKQRKARWRKMRGPREEQHQACRRPKGLALQPAETFQSNASSSPLG